MKSCALLLAALAGFSTAQEAASGIDLRATVSAEAAYSPDRSLAGARLVLYPTWKLNTHWTVTAALQGITRPYFYTDFATPGYRFKTDVLQASLNYTRVWNRASIDVRAGQLTTAFGSFLLRYDDAVNPLPGMPLAYGYYSTITPLGIPGAEINATLGRFDARAQFTNSSPANPRSLTQSDQYGGWAGGLGYKIKQGFRVGTSAYQGPYLDRKYQFFMPNEDEPKKLPATALGLDLQFAQGPWNLYSEWQHFRMDYRAIPVFTEHTGYAELRRVLTPRWFVATRLEYVRFGEFPGYQRYEVGAGYRPNRLQLAKLSYGIQQGVANTGVLTLQFVTSLDVFSAARQH